MDLIDRVSQLASRVEKQRDLCLTEEAAKTAFVLPFLQALGYDVFNPLEVRPEFVSDVGTKKGEKVDYAISLDGQVQILIECKPIGSKLELEHAGQLFRYFSVTSARFGVLTDGIRYCFYTDLDAPNKMDSRPFFVLDLLDYKDADIGDLKKFAKDAFDIDAIVSTAADMKYQRALADEIRREFAGPSDDFTKLIACRVYSGRFTQTISEKFSVLLKGAISDLIRERVDSRLKGALESRGTDGDVGDNGLENTGESDGITTTETEIDGFKIIRAISSEIIDPERVAIRDAKSYCGILLDNNNRKPIARLHFNNENNLRIQIFHDDNPEKLELSRLPDLYKHRELIHQAISRYTADNRPEPESAAGVEVSDNSVNLSPTWPE